MTLLSSRFSCALWLVCAFSALSQSSCTLMLPESDQLTVHKNPLPPIVETRDTIDLEIYIVDRRIGDPLIGDSLWLSLSPISATVSENRAHLAEDGFRFAMSSSRPPRTLQSLLQQSDERDPARRVKTHRYSVPSGQETILAISNVPDGTPFVRKTNDGVKTTELNQASCLFRVNAQAVEDGWARLTITPEIRHGASALRPVATDQSWQYNESQQVMPFYQHRLSAEVNSGEIVVLGLDSQKPDGLAACFFRSDIASGVERLIMIRVGEMRKVAPVRASQN